MTGIVSWATAHARMIVVFVMMSIAAGAAAYIGLPKEGEPDIDIPVLFVSVPFPGISAADSEKLLVKPMETELQGMDNLKSMKAIAAENYAGIALEFEFGWDKQATIADVRDKISKAESSFPDGAEQYSIDEINFSQFPIMVVSLSGQIPERTLTRVAKDLQTRLESLPPVLEATLAGNRDEMLEVLIDPLKLEAYDVTASELLGIVVNNNQLIAAGEVETGSGAFSVKIPSSFDTPQDIYSLPVKVNGDSVVTLRDLADIRLTFEDQTGTARYNGETTVALQIVKRKGFNHIDTANLVRQTVAEAVAEWPEELQQSLNVNIGLDQSQQVDSMIKQLEGSVLTAILLVMIVVLAALGVRSALLVGFAIPTSFLLSFAIMAMAGIAISNMVMFGLILAVGMLVDGAIVVVEYADKRIREGIGPMRAYGAAAKRMFWPVISSTATTLCAFLPMLFWPGVPGEFMRNLPVTLIFVLTASLLVALVYLPVVGGVAGRVSRFNEHSADFLRHSLHWTIRYALFAAVVVVLYLSMTGILRGNMGAGFLFAAGCMALSIVGGSLRHDRPAEDVRSGYRRSRFGSMIHFIVGNPVMPVVAIVAIAMFVGATFMVFSKNNNGVEFFVATEPENAIVYVRARGNLSLPEKDALVRQVENEVTAVDGVKAVFAFAGDGGLNQNTGGAEAPVDAIGQVQVELTDWEIRGTGTGVGILNEIENRVKKIPGIQYEILRQDVGPASGKPVNLRLTGQNWDDLLTAAETVRTKLEDTEGLVAIEDTRPLPGIDWQIDVDVEKAGRYGADVATVGAMVQLVTRGLKLDTMRVESSDDEIDIRARLPEQDRTLSTLDTLRVWTKDGLVPLSNFITRTPVAKLGQIERYDTERYFMVRAGVAEGLNANEKVAEVDAWLKADNPLPASVTYEFTGDQEDQAESGAFLSKAFLGALGLMFVILLAQFNSFYNSVLVLLAVVLSTTGVLIGMLVMGQTFSIIMTGTGIVALAGIVVNNNIVLIDTYQEYAKYMPKLQAIVRTVEARIRPVLLTTITTMAGLTPMMLGLSINFADGGFTIDSPTSLWWKQLATAVIFGLGIATLLTLVFTPSLLALRIWVTAGAYGAVSRLRAWRGGADSIAAADLALARAARRRHPDTITWAESDVDETVVLEEDDQVQPEQQKKPQKSKSTALKAAE
jgi:multidrug efflux pump